MKRASNETAEKKFDKWSYLDGRILAKGLTGALELVSFCFAARHSVKEPFMRCAHFLCTHTRDDRAESQTTCTTALFDFRLALESLGKRSVVPQNATANVALQTRETSGIARSRERGSGWIYVERVSSTTRHATRFCWHTRQSMRLNTCNVKKTKCTNWLTQYISCACSNSDMCQSIFCSRTPILLILFTLRIKSIFL